MRLKLVSKKKKKSSRKKTTAKPRLKTYAEDQMDLDEDDPFHDGDSAEVVAGGIMAEDDDRELELQGPVPQYKPGAPDDPFAGKPRVFYSEREYAIVVQDRRNLVLYRYSSVFSKKEQDIVSKYRRIGYHSTLATAIVGIRRDLERRSISLHQNQDLREILKWLDDQNQTLLQSVTHLEFHPSRCGADRS